MRVEDWLLREMDRGAIQGQVILGGKNLNNTVAVNALKAELQRLKKEETDLNSQLEVLEDKLSAVMQDIEVISSALRVLGQGTISILVQVNGKFRGNIEAPGDANEAAVVQTAMDYFEIQYSSGHAYVPGKLLNIKVPVQVAPLFTYEVESYTNPEKGYTISVYPERKATCTCPDFVIRKNRCKHIADRLYDRYEV